MEAIAQAIRDAKEEILALTPNELQSLMLDVKETFESKKKKQTHITVKIRLDDRQSRMFETLKKVTKLNTNKKIVAKLFADGISYDMFVFITALEFVKETYWGNTDSDDISQDK